MQTQLSMNTRHLHVLVMTFELALTYVSYAAAPF